MNLHTFGCFVSSLRTLTSLVRATFSLLMHVQYPLCSCTCNILSAHAQPLCRWRSVMRQGEVEHALKGTMWELQTDW